MIEWLCTTPTLGCLLDSVVRHLSIRCLPCAVVGCNAGGGFDCDTHVHPIPTPRSILSLLCPPLVMPPIAGAPRRGSCPIGVGGRGLGSACSGLRHVAVFQVWGARNCVVSGEKSEEDRS